MKLLIGVVLVLLLITSVSAEIVYSDQFYENQNYSSDKVMSLVEYKQLATMKNTNELLMKQNELLQDQNNLTITQNEILRRIYEVLVHSGIGFSMPYPKKEVYYPRLDV